MGTGRRNSGVRGVSIREGLDTNGHLYCVYFEDALSELYANFYYVDTFVNFLGMARVFPLFVNETLRSSL